MERRRSRVWLGCGPTIKRGFNVRREGIDDRAIRPAGATGRHHTAAQFQNHFLPGLGIIANMLEVDLVEHEAGCFRFFVMTRDAILVQEWSVLCGSCGSRKHQCSERCNSHDAHFAVPVSFWSSATVLGLRSAPTDARNTPSAQVIGVRPTASFTSKRAPFSTRN